MRNPVRLKNLRVRFIPFFVLGAIALWLARPSPIALAMGSLLVLVGALLRSWGAGHLVKNESLTITGPYAHIRHPLYLGTLLVGTGFALIAGGGYSIVLLLLFLPWFFLAYFPRKDRVEGERLVERYGADYASYRGAVPALLPRWSAWRPPVPSEWTLGDPDRSWSLERYSDNNELGTLIALAAGLLLFWVRAWTGA